MGCARSGKKLAHEKQALGRKKFRLGDPPNPTKVCASEIANPSEPRTAHLLDLDCLQVKKSRAPPPFPCCNDRSFRSAVFVVNARFPLPNRYRHAPARGFGAPARCRALREGASILVQRRNRPRLRVFADYVAFKTRQGRLSAPLGRALKEVESEQPRDQAICCWQEAGRLAGGLRTQHNRQKPVKQPRPPPNRCRHAPARGFGAPARCRALREGASIPVYQRNPIDLAKTRRSHPPRRTDRRAAESPTHGWVYVCMDRLHPCTRVPERRREPGMGCKGPSKLCA